MGRLTGQSGRCVQVRFRGIEGCGPEAKPERAVDVQGGRRLGGEGPRSSLGEGPWEACLDFIVLSGRDGSLRSFDGEGLGNCDCLLWCWYLLLCGSVAKSVYALVVLRVRARALGQTTTTFGHGKEHLLLPSTLSPLSRTLIWISIGTRR